MAINNYESVTDSNKIYSDDRVCRPKRHLVGTVNMWHCGDTSWRHHDVTLNVTLRLLSTVPYLWWNKCYRLNLGVDFTIFEAEELENDEIIHVELVRDLESDCDVTISVTCRIYSNKNDTRSILVSILPYSKLRNSKIMKWFMWNLRVT
jgi:hypothetical protein